MAPRITIIIFFLLTAGCNLAPKAPITSDQHLITMQDVQHLSLKSAEDPSLTPVHGANDQGGVASVTDLEQDMRDMLINWHQAANMGVTQFTTSELSGRIDQVESGDWTETIMSLLGNTIWAGTVFSTASSGTIFGISMAGILIATAPVIPSSVVSTIPEIQDEMIKYMQSIYDQLNNQLRNKAMLIIERYPGITRYRALTIFVQESFKTDLYRFDPTYRSPPSLNKQAISKLYKNWPTAILPSQRDQRHGKKEG